MMDSFVATLKPETGEGKYFHMYIHNLTYLGDSDTYSDGGGELEGLMANIHEQTVEYSN